LKVELHGLEVFGHHGVEDDERRNGQPFWFDVELEVGDAGLTDRIEDAVDYTKVAARIREISTARSFRLLEALATAVADAIAAEFPVESVSVRVRKRPADLPVEWTAASARRPR
jgi:7,8-dihydroneopterin aldolase/epimerase/oxygenase